MKTSIVIGLLVCANLAFAQTSIKRASAKATAPAATSTTTRTGAPDAFTGHLSVGLTLPTASSLNGVTAQDNAGTQKLNGDLNTESGMGFMAEYKDTFRPNWNWAAGVAYYRERVISSFKYSGGTATFPNKPSYQSIVVSGGFQYLVNDMVYIPFGLNLPIVNPTTKGSLKSFEMNPLLGYQFGIGVAFQKVAAIELINQTHRYSVDSKINDNARMQGDAELNGFTLQGRYMF